jgi:hypothetical protein
MTFPGGRGSVRAAFSGSDGASPSRYLQKANALSQLNFGVGGFCRIDHSVGNKEVPMQKRYIVRLTDQERDELRKVVKKLKRR